MQRLALAVIAIAIVVAVIALVMRSIAREVENRGGLAELTTGGTMQKVAFFMLLCLIAYVSISGAS